MSKSVEVRLGANKYNVPMLNIGQLERIQEAFDDAGKAGKSPRFCVLKIALERAEPKVGNFEEEVVATIKEIKEAQEAIAKMSGIEASTPGPNAKAPAAKPGKDSQ